MKEDAAGPEKMRLTVTLRLDLAAARRAGALPAVEELGHLFQLWGWDLRREIRGDPLAQRFVDTELSWRGNKHG